MNYRKLAILLTSIMVIISVFLLASVSAIAVNTTYSENVTGVTSTGVFAGNIKGGGERFTVDYGGLSLVYVMKVPISNATNATLRTTAGVNLTSATFVGNKATFTVPYNLTRGATYDIVTHANGGEYGCTYSNSVTYPQDLNTVTYVGDINCNGVLATTEATNVVGIVTHTDIIIENYQTFNNLTTSGVIESFAINSTVFNSISSANLVYNNTKYPSTSIVSSGLNYLISESITIPTITSQTNKTFYWEFLIGGQYYNSTSNNQTINSFAVDNCNTNTVLLLNYTILDEITKALIPDADNISLNLYLKFYNLDYETLVSQLSLNSSKNNTKICIQSNLTSNATYYLDVEAQYFGGGDRVTRFNYIQKQPLSNTTIPQNINLYSINSSLSTEFILTFKNDNFVKESGVLVDVTRKYIEDGIFRTVEIPKTDTDGKVILHLQTGEAIYSITFKKNGEVLTVLDNIVAKCQSDILGECTINVNAYSSNIEIPDFTYNNGIYLIEILNKETKTITSTFTSESGTNNVVLNVTKFDRFGNTTICSSSVVSSSGSLSCVVPESYGNSTIISTVYSNGFIVSSNKYSLRDYTPDTGGSYVILSLLIVITLSMMFISDLRGVLIGCFIGLVLSTSLVFINSGNLFSVGAVTTWALIIIVLLIWKINHKEEN